LHDEDAIPVKKGKATTSKKGKDADDDEEEDDAPDEVDEWEKVEEEEEWDPDFEEFDLPKSRGKKAVGGKKVPEEEDDLKLDDEFKDLFNDKDSYDDDDDDEY
jgi:DNA-directed RNA polymerase subunit delta